MKAIPKHFKLVNEHPHSYEIHDSRDNKRFHVSKQALDLGMHAKLSKIQKFDEGGDVQRDPQSEQAPVVVNVNAQPAPNPNMPRVDEAAIQGAAQAQARQKASDAVAAQRGQVAMDELAKRRSAIDAQAIQQTSGRENAPMPGAAPASQGPGSEVSLVSPENQVSLAPKAAASAAGAPAQPGDLLSEFDKNEKTEAAGIQGVANAQTKAAEQTAAAYKDSVQKMQQIQSTFQERTQALDKESQDLTKAVLDSKIDPQRWFNNKSTIGKISTGLGVILGGIGAGLQHSNVNQAMQFINNQISNDIDAQKSELGKKQNLLSVNMQKYGNLNAATAATVSQLSAVTQAQVAKAIADNPSFAAAGQQVLAHMKNENLERHQKLAVFQTGLNMAKGQAGINPELLPPEMRERAVQLPGGKLALAPTKEDATDVRKSLTSLNHLEQEVKKYIQFVNEKGRVANPWGAAATEANNLQSSITLQLNALHGLNRLTDIEFEQFKKMLSNPGSWNQTKALAGAASILDIIKGKRDAEYENHLEGFSPGQIKEGAPVLGKK